MSKVENLQTTNRAKPFPCVSVALVVLAMFVLSWLAAKGVRNNLQTPLIFAGLCLTNLHRGTAQPSEQVGDHRLRRSAGDHIRFRIFCPTWPGFDWQHGPVARRFRGEYLHLVRRSSLGVHACETSMSAAQGADRSGVADGALAHFHRPIADVTFPPPPFPAPSSALDCPT